MKQTSFVGPAILAPMRKELGRFARGILRGQHAMRHSVVYSAGDYEGYMHLECYVTPNAGAVRCSCIFEDTEIDLEDDPVIARVTIDIA